MKSTQMIDCRGTRLTTEWLDTQLGDFIAEYRQLYPTRKFPRPLILTSPAQMLAFRNDGGTADASTRNTARYCYRGFEWEVSIAMLDDALSIIGRGIDGSIRRIFVNLDERVTLAVAV